MFRLPFRIVLISVALSLSAPTVAQEVKPDPINEVSRYKVYFYKFAPNGKDRARQLVWDHMLPAMREARLPEPIILHPDDGEWDMVSLYPLNGGYNDLHFNTSPSDSKWQSIALRKGGEKFTTLAQQVAASIVRETSFVAHRHD